MIDNTEKKASAILSGLLNGGASASHGVLLQNCAELLAQITSRDAKTRDGAKTRVLQLAKIGGWHAHTKDKAVRAVSEEGGDPEKLPKIAGTKWKPEEIAQLKGLWRAHSSQGLQGVELIAGVMGRSVLAILVRLYLEGGVSVEQGDAFCTEANIRPLSSVESVRKLLHNDA